MNSLFTVNNHVSVSLLSVTVTPSTFLTALVVILTFISLYLSFYLGPLTASAAVLTAPIRRLFTRPLAQQSQLVRKPAPTAPATIPLALGPDLIERRPLPALPAPEQNQDTALLDEFEPTVPSRRFAYPSHHSGFRSEVETIDDDEIDPDRDSVSAGGYSPPAWRRLENGDRSNGFWRRTDNLLGGYRASRESSPSRAGTELDADLDILARAVRTKLPTGSLSPEKGQSPDPDQTPMKIDQVVSSSSSKTPVQENYIRFAVRAEVQQRTEPIEAAITFFRNRLRAMTRSWAAFGTSLVLFLLSMIAIRSVFQPIGRAPAPDLIKVAGLARLFEPLIYYSESGATQVHELQATSVAVWDLGESVRLANMTGAIPIFKELDDLSETMKTLALELTKFFASVDGDIDGILIVMDWARRELAQVNDPPTQAFTTAFDNIHQSLTHAGVLESSDGAPTALGHLVTSVFGKAPSQRTRHTLQKTFNEFLSVLEQAIDSELHSSLALFSLFGSIDQQFLNVARLAARESSEQEGAQEDLLEKMWTRILGPNAAQLRKFERNRDLLRDVRENMLKNKGVLMDHNTKLIGLKSGLESLRRRLMSPLVQNVQSNSLTVEEQIKGLEDVGGHLEEIRKQQKGKLMDLLFGGGNTQMMIDEKRRV